MKPKDSFTFTQIVTGFELAAHARRLSQHTIDDYLNTFRKFQVHLNSDPPFDTITKTDIEAFLAAQHTLSNKTLLNYHTGLSALWTWAISEELATTHLLRQIRRPRPEQRGIVPFSEADIRAMLNALGESRPYHNKRIRTSTNRLPNKERNHAIILLLLDTGMRANELCSLTLDDIDTKNSRLKVMGKGAKERYIPYSPRTGQVLWRYMLKRKSDFTNRLFVNTTGEPMNRDRLLKQLHSIGGRAKVTNVHPHRFRHTFAINYLRNGGDPYTLKMILGHSTLTMVYHYLAIAQSDVDARHRLASPVMHMHL